MIHQPMNALALRVALQQFLSSGEVQSDLVPPALSASWQRSHDAGLSIRDDFSTHPSEVDTARLRVAQHALAGWMTQARPTLEWLSASLQGSGSVLLVSNAEGLLLEVGGDAALRARSEGAGLHAGALWGESDRGSNGLGTALATGEWAHVHGAEHYLERHSLLTTAGLPLRASDGQVFGGLGLAHLARAPWASSPPAGRAFLTLAASLLEDRHFHHRHRRDQLLHLHPHAEGLGLPGEGLLAMSDDGWVVGANAPARDWLGVTPAHIGAVTVDRLLGLGAHLSVQSRPSRWTTPQGRSFFLRDDPERRPKSGSAATADDFRGHSRPALAAQRDSEDPRVSLALRKAWRVQDMGIPLLLLGESGTGKEAFARNLHREGPRARHPFVVMNCGAMAPDALDGALFGRVSADVNGGVLPGAMQQAEGGILFLDEVADLPLPLQGRLLKALRDQSVVPVDAHQALTVDVVLVCATRKHLPEAVAKGQFREDLYHQLNGLAIHLPPLRDRSDFTLLAQATLQTLAKDLRLPEVPVLSEHLDRVLPGLRWPGNLRQLHSALRTACALLPPDEQVIRAEHLPDDVQEALKQKDGTGGHLRMASSAWPGHAVQEAVNLRQLSDSVIEQTIQACQGNMSEAARRLGISRNTLYRRCKGAA